MTSVRGRGRPRRERSSVVPSVAPPDSSLPLESGDKLSNELAGPLRAKLPIVTYNILKYSKDNL